jgi:hypothetical protein
LPIVLDAGGGGGDPVHVHRTIALAEETVSQLSFRGEAEKSFLRMWLKRQDPSPGSG